MENLIKELVTKTVRDKYVKGTKDKGKTISGQSYADKHGLEGLPYLICQAKTEFGKMAQDIMTMPKEFQTDVAETMGLMIDNITKFKAEIANTKGQKKIAALGPAFDINLSEDDIIAINKILRKS